MDNLILAINDGIGSSIGLFKNGEPIFCVEEERFNRIKNWLGFPELAFNYLFESNKINANDIDYVVITNQRLFSEGKDSFYKYYDLNFEAAYNLLTSGNTRIDYLIIDNKIISRK